MHGMVRDIRGITTLSKWKMQIHKFTSDHDLLDDAEFFSVPLLRHDCKKLCDVGAELFATSLSVFIQVRVDAGHPAQAGRCSKQRYMYFNSRSSISQSLHLPRVTDCMAGREDCRSKGTAFVLPLLQIACKYITTRFRTTSNEDRKKMSFLFSSSTWLDLHETSAICGPASLLWYANTTHCSSLTWLCSTK